MNHEILFRGKRLDNGEWIEGFYFKWRSGNSYLLIEKMIEIDNPKYPISDIEFIPVVTETVGQYTGLTDKNGRKIFEGDIITCDVVESVCAAVKYSESKAAFWLEDENGAEEYLGEAWDTDVIVIGNIFDNPELMKGE